MEKNNFPNEGLRSFRRRKSENNLQGRNGLLSYFPVHPKTGPPPKKKRNLTNKNLTFTRYSIITRPENRLTMRSAVAFEFIV